MHRGSRVCKLCSVKTPADHISETDTTKEMSLVVGEQVRTLADLIRVCEIDITTWEIERWVANKWEMGYKDKKQVAHTTPLFQIKVWLKKRVALVAARDEITALIKDAKKAILRTPTHIRSINTGYLLEIAIPDLHIGKLAWGHETGGAHYDVKIAEQLFEDALETLIARSTSYTFEQVLFPIGNDLLNADNMAGTTTAGTAQDTDARFQKTFLTARKMVTRAIERLRLVAPVSVLMVPGNHDQLSVWNLGDSLDCYFNKYTDVFIDNAPTFRKYFQFGKVMLLLTHGDKGKKLDYPSVMAAEQPVMWGETVHREAHTGHLHQTRTEEKHGTKMRISPALCPPDAWHSHNQYVGQQRGAEAFIFHREQGLISQVFYTVPEEKTS